MTRFEYLSAIVPIILANAYYFQLFGLAVDTNEPTSPISLKFSKSFVTISHVLFYEF